MLTLLILKLLQSPIFPLQASTQHVNTKELFPLLLYFLQTQLIIASLLLLGTISGKVPCFITAETYYFRQVSWFPYEYIASLGPRLPFWATAKVVP